MQFLFSKRVISCFCFLFSEARKIFCFCFPRRVCVVCSFCITILDLYFSISVTYPMDTSNSPSNLLVLHPHLLINKEYRVLISPNRKNDGYTIRNPVKRVFDDLAWKYHGGSKAKQEAFEIAQRVLAGFPFYKNFSAENNAVSFDGDTITGLSPPDTEVILCQCKQYTTEFVKALNCLKRHLSEHPSSICGNGKKRLAYRYNIRGTPCYAYPKAATRDDSLYMAIDLSGSAIPAASEQDSSCDVLGDFHLYDKLIN